MFVPDLTQEVKDSLITSLSAYVSRLGQEPAALIFQAEICWLRGEEAEAEVLLRSATTNGDSSVAALAKVCLADILAARGHEDDALTLLAGASTVLSTSFIALWHTAQLQQRKGQTDAALVSFEDALRGPVELELLAPFTEEYVKLLEEKRGRRAVSVSIREIIKRYGPNARLQDLLTIYEIV